jgi:hypothetical protein
MPAHIVPFVVAIIAFFATFMVAIGGASLWVALPTPKGRSREARQRHRFASPAMAQASTAHRGT